MNRYYFSFFVLLLAVLSSCSTTKRYDKFSRRIYNGLLPDSIVYLNRLIVNDSSIYPILDLIIYQNSQCVHHVMGEDTWIELFSRDEGNDTILITLEAQQYSSILNRSDTGSVVNSKYYGIFYYKDYLIAVSQWANALSYFFEKTDSIEKIVFLRHNVTVYTYLFGAWYRPQEVFTYYYYVNERYIPYISHCWCDQYHPIYHRMRKKDSLESLSEKYRVTKEQIIRLNNLKEPILPKKGEIRIQ